MHSDQAEWVGAWWIGYVVVSLLGLLNGVFLLGFPEELPGRETLKTVYMYVGM